MQHIPRRLAYLLALPLLGVMQLSHAEIDDSLAAALDNLWGSDQPKVSELSTSFGNETTKAGVAFTADVKNSPVYLLSAGDSASIIVGKKRFDAIVSPWGNFPRLDMQTARLLELSVAKKRYLVVVGKGEGVFSAGNWQRYAFLQVLDVSSASAPLHYALVSDAGLEERVLGRLPHSDELNYARLVATHLDKQGAATAYEVSLYALAAKGPTRVLEDGRPLAYSLTLENGSWLLDRLSGTPVTNSRDEEKRSFSAPLRPPLFFKVAPSSGAAPLQ